MTFFSKPRRYLLAAAGLVSVLGLAACGGGGSDSGTAASWASVSGSDAVTALKITDTTVGTGTAATATSAVSVNATGWLYDVRVATTQKGAQIQAPVTIPVTKLGQNPRAFITGFEQGIVGMKVGGKRTVVIPAALAYDTAGNASGGVPPNAALIFDLELLSAQ